MQAALINDHLDGWVPQQGAYVPDLGPSAGGAFVNVFGPFYDGWALGQVVAAPGIGDKRTCLAALDPTAMLRVVARQCALPEVGEWGSVSPDGKLLAYQSPGQAANFQTAVVDPGAVFDRPAVLATWLSKEGVSIGDTMLA